MRAVIQRVSQASVSVDGKVISSIDSGAMVLLGIKKGDAVSDADYIVDKIVNLRIYDDENGIMNLPITSGTGKILLVSQFTLYGDARKGRRPSYSNAASGDEAEKLYLYVADKIKQQGAEVLLGSFGADMKVSLINDGPVTILLDSEKVI